MRGSILSVIGLEALEFRHIDDKRRPITGPEANERCLVDGESNHQCASSFD